MNKEERTNVRDNARVTLGCLVMMAADGILSSGTTCIIIGIASLLLICYLLSCKSFVKSML